MLQKSKINLLPIEISEKIAAGEVVDRPFSIVKELVENSIDAGAENIVVEIKNGGKTYIRVTDNGSGIPGEEAERAFTRHATSKIQTLEDLNSIATLGFRGEALTSIAAVSKVELITKPAGWETGTRLLLEGGRLIENRPTGCPDGTTIIVRDVFYNTPARLKFLKSDSAESSLIIDLISRMALAYPYVRFRMINNDTVLFATRGKGGIYNNILTIYSRETGSRLIEIEEDDGDYHLLAYISPPDINRATKRGQVYFVNGRSVRDKVLEAAVSDAYRERLSEGRSPLIYMFLQVAPDTVDVNIHPNKKEVRFEDSRSVADFVTAALIKGLKSDKGLAALRIKSPFKDQLSKIEYPVPATTVSDSETMHDPAGLVPAGQVDIKSLLSAIRLDSIDSIENEGPGHERESTKTMRFGELIPLGSIFATYILAADEFRFCLIDQHAAHERIFYEKLLRQFNSSLKNTQLLISPIMLDTSPAAAGYAEIWIEKLTEMGFAIEPFGLKTFRVNGIPSFMEISGAVKFLENFVEEMGEEMRGSAIVVAPEKLNKIISRSCKSAVKANNVLSREEIRYLLSELDKTENPLSCPHGRPTVLMLSKQDIEKLFKR
ncbi:DNA mismatch repair endonuclease MutL [Bacillota bacterium]